MSWLQVLQNEQNAVMLRTSAILYPFITGRNPMLSEPGNTAATPHSTAIPVQFSAPEVAAVLLPHLSLPKRGPQGKLGSHQPFNSILKVLYTGRQWKELPLDKDPEGHAELPYTGVFKRFARGAEDGSLERAFLASVNQVDEAHQLDLSLLHGDGSNSVAKKGGMPLARAATNPRKGRT
jgi:hypothetical protein